MYLAAESYCVLPANMGVKVYQNQFRFVNNLLRLEINVIFSFLLIFPVMIASIVIVVLVGAVVVVIIILIFCVYFSGGI